MMAYQQSDLDTINAAIATGALSVRYADGRTVVYRSIREMRQVQMDIQAALTPATPPVMRVVGGYSSGLS